MSTLVCSNGNFVFNESTTRPVEFVKSPFRYPGGKYYGLKYILPFLTCVPHDEYREPFVGGGSVFFAKPKAPINWLNDLESDLIDTYKAIASEKIRKKLTSMVTCEIASRERHAEVKEIQPRTLVERAFKTYYLNRTSYSGIIHKPAWGYEIGQSSPPQNWGNFIDGAGKKLSGVELTSLDFESVLLARPRGKKVLMYLDPPYFNADQKRAYTKSFEIADHIRLADLLKQTKFFFCLSYDDSEEVRDLYRWANIHERSWLYNTANHKEGPRKVGNELIITNYDVLPAQKSFF